MFVLGHVSVAFFGASYLSSWYCPCSVVFMESLLFFFKQKTAYEMRISDWSSDVCSSDLTLGAAVEFGAGRLLPPARVGAHGDLGSRQGRPGQAAAREIGRASCRERVCQ